MNEPSSRFPEGNAMYFRPLFFVNFKFMLMDVEMRGNLLSLYFLPFAYKSLALLCYHTL